MQHSIVNWCDVTVVCASIRKINDDPDFLGIEVDVTLDYKGHIKTFNRYTPTFEDVRKFTELKNEFGKLKKLYDFVKALRLYEMLRWFAKVDGNSYKLKNRKKFSISYHSDGYMTSRTIYLNRIEQNSIETLIAKINHIVLIDWRINGITYKITEHEIGN